MQSTKKPGSLLDVGTGIGQFLATARNSYAEVHGSEVSSVAIRLAKEKYNLDILQGTIEDINWQGKVFDNISLSCAGARAQSEIAIANVSLLALGRWRPSSRGSNE
jgi:ubiquinone/menaquinone biosynthesis C-methylase UbiE